MKVISLIAMSLSGFFAIIAIAQEKKESISPICKELKLEQIEIADLKPLEPLVIESEKSLEKRLENKEIIASILKQIDFSKEKLVVFKWAGSGQDKLTFSEKDKAVVFSYKRGLTRDLRQHQAIFAIAKDAELKLSKE